MGIYGREKLSNQLTKQGVWCINSVVKHRRGYGSQILDAERKPAGERLLKSLSVTTLELSPKGCTVESALTMQRAYEISYEQRWYRVRPVSYTHLKRHAIVIISEKITDVHMFAKKISQTTGFSGRATVLGHVQRGGSPTPTDRVMASRMGEKAVDLLMQGIGGQCVSIRDNAIVGVPIEEALNIPRASRRQLQNLFDRLV